MTGWICPRTELRVAPPEAAAIKEDSPGPKSCFFASINPTINPPQVGARAKVQAPQADSVPSKSTNVK